MFGCAYHGVQNEPKTHLDPLTQNNQPVEWPRQELFHNVVMSSLKAYLCLYHCKDIHNLKILIAHVDELRIPKHSLVK